MMNSNPNSRRDSTDSTTREINRVRTGSYSASSNRSNGSIQAIDGRSTTTTTTTHGKRVTYDGSERDNSSGLASRSISRQQISNGHDQEFAAASRRYLSSSSDNLIQSTLAPEDKYKLVCIGFTILGITTLLPWNFFITATDYWMYKFRDVALPYDANMPHTYNRTPLQTFFESYLAIAANLPMLASMLINSLYAQGISQKKRLYWSLSVMLIIFAMTTAFVKIDTDQMQGVFFGVTLLMVVIISLFSATFQAAIFGIVASFPNECMHSMVNGQAGAGLLAVAIQIMAMANNTGPEMSGLWYFLASTIFLALAILCYWMMDNDYSRYYLLRIPDEDELSTSLSVNLIESKHELLEALEDCWQMVLSVILAFWASLAVFPGVCVLVVPEYPNSSWLTGRFFVPITSFLLFNLGDLAGRLISSFVSFPAHKKNALLTLTIGRGFIPLLIIFCNVVPRTNTSMLLPSDLMFPILVGLTALTNGYIFSSAMIMASHNARNTRLELTGFCMASALGLGLTLGSITSTIILRII